MNYILGVAFILILLFLINNFLKKKQLIKFRKHLYNNWGKKKENEYYNFYVIEKYFKNNPHKDKAYHIITEKSKIDIDIDDVFKFIDRTVSKVGQQYLYFKLRTIDSIDNLLKFEDLTSLFQKNKDLSISCQLELSKLNSNNSYYLEELINGKQLTKPKFLWLVKLSTLISITSFVVMFFYPIVALLLVPVLAVNMVLHYKNKNNIGYYLNGAYQLSRALKVSKSLSKINEISYHFENLSFIKKINSIKFKTEFIAFEKNIDNEFLFTFWFVAEIFKILFNIEYLAFYSFVGAIEKEKESIDDMFVFIGKIDAAISTASLKSGNLKTCTPEFNKNNVLKALEIYHPLIDNCVANTVNLTNKSMLLTGSNMSGKTTFIRTIAINSILAQTLHLCFAKEYSAPFYKVFSSIRITDDLLDNTSYYLQEVLTIKDLIKASEDKHPCLFVLDEIFKGTNTVERISGGKAILKYLNKLQHTVLVSTHDIELTELLVEENYDLFHFSEQIENEKLVFDHKIKNGKLKTRNAIKILDLYKYPKEIIVDAREVEITFNK